MDKQSAHGFGKALRFSCTLKSTCHRRVGQSLTKAPNKLLDNPCIGEKLEEFLPREVRRILIGSYEMRYEIRAETIYLLRVWHTREER